jgi:hypothetical protein
MSSIKVLLIAFTGLSVIIASVALPSRVAYRLLAAAFFAAATSLIIFPESSTTIANFLGVGRGTDLLLYVGVFAGIHAFLLLYARTRRLEKKFADFVRASAIRGVTLLGTPSPAGSATLKD